MLHAGTRLNDRYVLREPIARGGMGEVWRAEDTVLGRVVAVKVLLPTLSGDREFAERFRTEARAMAALSDPGIVEVYDYGQAHGVAYLVMQYVPGEPLHALLGRVGALPPHQTMTMVAQAARALHQAHGNGIVHRDVKPGNVLIRPDGRLMLTDFGIARIIAADGVTAAGEIIGTASYLAPEQVTGGPVGPATDVYALGVVAYECLTLRRPFDADTPIAVAMMHARDEPPPLPSSVPQPVRHVVMRALTKEPRQRWASAAAMADAASVAAGSVPASAPAGRRPPASIPPPSLSRLPTRPAGDSPPRARRRLAWVAAVVLVGALVGWTAFNGVTGDGGAAPPSASMSPTGTAVASDRPTAGTSLTSTTTTPPTASRPVAPATKPAAPTATARRTPGPNERQVPDVIGEYEMAASYAIYAAGLVAEATYVVAPDACYVIDQTPAPGAIVAVDSTVKITVARSSEDCQPV